MTPAVTTSAPFGTLVGEFPTIRLKHAATEVRDYDRYANFPDIPYYGLEHVRSYTGDFLKNESETPTSLVARFRPGNVLFGKLRPYLAKVALPTFQGTTSTEVIVLNPHSNYDARFLRYVLLSKSFLDAVNVSTYGTRMPRTSWGIIGNMRIPNPPLDIQRRIADFLDRETAQIDELIDKTERLFFSLERHWKSVLETHIYGLPGLDSGPRPRNGMKRSIPGHWRTVSLKHLVDPQRPLMYGIVLPGPHVEDGVMIVKGGDVKPGRLSPSVLARTAVEIDARHARSRLRKGDLVISIRGAVGDVEIVPRELEGANLTQDTARVSPRHDVSNMWLRYALLSPSVSAQINERVRGAAVRGISIFDLSQIRIPTPPVGEQRQIADALARLESTLSNLGDKIRRHQEKLQEFRSALITEAVTGRIDPSTL